MECDDCGAEVRVDVEHEFKLTGKSTTVSGDSIAGSGQIMESVNLTCDCRTVQAQRTGYKVPAIPDEWVNGEEVSTFE